MSLKLLITDYCRANWPNFVHKGTLGRKAILEWHYENENLGRRCRELENEGKLEKRIIKGCVEYRYIKQTLPIARKPVNTGLF